MKRHWLAIIALMTFVSVNTARAANWTEFRGPSGQGISEETNVPTEWGPDKNITWKVSIEGNGWSSPIYLDGRLYLTTAIPKVGGEKYDQTLRTLCVNAKTGEKIWDEVVFDQTSRIVKRVHNKNSHASPTPITDGKNLYVHFGTVGTACLTLGGQIVWKNQELRYNPVHGNGGSPVLVDSKVIVICDGGDVNFLVAMDQETGNEVWRIDRTAEQGRKFAFSTPLLLDIDGKKQLVCPGAGSVRSYDPKDGREIWRADYPGGYSVIPRPVYGNGLVYICTGYGTPHLMAIDPTGTGNVTNTHVEWVVKKAVPHSASLLLVGKDLYMVSDRGIASCLDATSGEVIWQERVGGNYSASPIYADGKVYFQSEQGDGTVLKAGRDFEVLAKNSLRARTLASYAIADSALFIRFEGGLVRVD